MKYRIFAFILLICIAITLPLSTTFAEETILEKGDTGSEVYALQRRLNELGYLNYRPTGKFSDMTAQAVQKFQQLNEQRATGQVTSATKQAVFSVEAVRNESNPEFNKIVGRADTGNNPGKGVLSAWTAIDKKFHTDDVITLTDYNTQTTFEVKRIGGINCAQVVTATEEDYNNFLEIFGGGETWEHRAVLADIGGTKYAASLFGMPTHTESSGESGMSGYTILYFNSSNTDVYTMADEEHAIAITRIS